MRVAADVVEDLSRAGERRFRVDDPVGLARQREMIGKGLAIGQGREGPGEAELPRVERLLQRLEQQPSKQAERTRTGRKKPGRRAIQRVPSGDRPPRVRRSADADDGTRVHNTLSAHRAVSTSLR